MSSNVEYLIITQLQTADSHLTSRSSSAERTIPFLHGNGLARVRALAGQRSIHGSG